KKAATSSEQKAVDSAGKKAVDTTGKTTLDGARQKAIDSAGKKATTSSGQKPTVSEIQKKTTHTAIEPTHPSVGGARPSIPCEEMEEDLDHTHEKNHRHNHSKHCMNTNKDDKDADFTCEENYTVEKVLDCKWSHGTLKYKIKWEGWGPKFDSWEPSDTMISDIPDMLIEYHKKHPLPRKRLVAPTADVTHTPSPGQDSYESDWDEDQLSSKKDGMSSSNWSQDGSDNGSDEVYRTRVERDGSLSESSDEFDIDPDDDDSE
ncbi:hypothetical protein T484DRAFT_1757853, partial [Baffinella frigidus]